MSPASSPAQGPLAHRRMHPAAWGLVLAFPVALLPFASVHPLPRALVALVVAGAGSVACIHFGFHRRGASRCVVGLSALAATCVGLSALMLVPVSAEVRRALQPGLAGVLGSALGLAGASDHPLALAPARALDASSFVAASVLMAAGTACAVRRRGTARLLSEGLVVSMVLLAGFAWIERLTGASHIGWISSVPASTERAPFFGTVVNPNQAGVMLAAAIPLALALAATARGPEALLPLMAAGVLAVATWSTGSRGAVAEAGVAVLVLVGLGGGRRARRAVLTIAVVVAFGVAVFGARRTVSFLSGRLLPDPGMGDTLGLRPQIWADAVRLVGAAPWVGVGPGGFLDAFPVVKTMREFTLPDHAHLDALQALIENGVVLGSVWIALVWGPVLMGARRALRTRHGRKRIRLAGWVAAATAILMGTLYGFPLRVGAVEVLFAECAGVLVGLPAREGSVGRRWQGVWAVALAVLALASLGGLASAVATVWAPSSELAAVEPALDRADAAWKRAVADKAHAAEPLAMVEAAARSAIARRPLDHRGLLRLARAEAASRDYDAARHTLEVTTEAYPTLPWPWFALGRIGRRLGDVDAARASWRRGLALDLADNDEALPYVKEALDAEADPVTAAGAILPDRADRLRDGAWVLARAGHEAAARRLYARAVARDPKVAVALASELVNWGEAERAWLLIQSISDRSCAAVRTGARALLDLGRLADSIRWFSRALSRCGADDEATLQGLARARVRAHDPRAIGLLRRLIAAHPDDVHLRRLLIEALGDAGRDDEVVAELQDLVDRGMATARDRARLERLRHGLPEEP